MLNEEEVSVLEAAEKITTMIIGRKDDENKAQWHLVQWNIIDEAVEVLTAGAKKYGEFNWQQVERKRYVDALMRHITAYLKGEFVDVESGKSHLAHALCNIMFVYELDKLPVS